MLEQRRCKQVGGVYCYVLCAASPTYIAGKGDKRGPDCHSSCLGLLKRALAACDHARQHFEEVGGAFSW